MTPPFPTSILARHIALAWAALTLGLPVLAADAAPAQTITITAKSGAYLGEKDTAAALAPTQSSLQATQPQSIITREFIEQSVAPTAEYSRVVNIAPSLSGDSANGPGLSETKTTMRGFSDDQYNITFDGIPWGDTNNPAHHSTSFFPAAVIGAAVVERGPGNASNLGFATFGGSINLFSKKAGAERETSVFAALGTWNTQLYGVAFESGKLADFGNGTLQLNLQHLQSDGYLTLNSIKSDNLTAKVERSVGASSVLTLFASVNRIQYTQPDNSKGPTLAQVAQYGKNFSLNSDPTSFNYAGFNHTGKDTDFEYARLRTDWSAELRTEAQVYSYAYNNQTISSTDPTGLSKPGTQVGPPGNLDIPGIDKQNKYRVYGGMFKAEQVLAAGLLRAGLWVEHSDSDRHQYDLDLTLGNVRDPRETKPVPVQFPSVKFDQLSKIDTLQPYAEFEWQPREGMTVTPGVKFVSIKRSVDAPVNQTSRTPLNTSVDYRTTLPFLTVNQQLAKGLAVYGQYAGGFQIPDLNTLYIANPTQNSSEPQKSTNYQLGIVGQSPRLTWDADLYQIDFKNKLVSNGLGGPAAAFVNIGGATYKGIEGQATYWVGGGFAAYVNGSVNKATALDTGKQISGAPAMTAALGALYSAGPWSASLIAKRTGATYQQEYATNPALYEQYKVAAYNNLDLGASYTFRGIAAIGAKSLKLQVNVFNLLNRQDTTSISGTGAAAQYSFQAPRSLQVSAKATF
jgi:iron complex outermembrane receptor protein